jgi:hypothetical protein
MESSSMRARRNGSQVASPVLSAFSKTGVAAQFLGGLAIGYQKPRLVSGEQLIQIFYVDLRDQYLALLGSAAVSHVIRGYDT